MIRYFFILYLVILHTQTRIHNDRRPRYMKHRVGQEFSDVRKTIQTRSENSSRALFIPTDPGLYKLCRARAVTD